MSDHPNFLTCPAVPELPAPRTAEKVTSSPSKDSQPAKTPANRKKIFFWIIGLIAVVLICITLIPPAIALVRAGLAVQEARAAVTSMQRMLTQGDMETAQSEANRARVAFNDLHDALQGVGFWRDVPYVGVQIRAVQEAATVSSNSMDGVNDLLKAATAIFDAISTSKEASGNLSVPISPADRLKDLTKEQKRELLQALYQSLPQIRLAREKIDIALTLWQNIPQDQVASPIKDALKPLADALPVLQKSLDQAVPLIEVLVPLAGYPASQHYVIALQNADELRPAGGFIGSIVTADVNAGDLSSFAFSDVYNVDTPAAAAWKEVPPKPLADHLGVKQWFMRDANWSPDFPTSAERVLDFYERETAIKTGKPTPSMTGFVAFEPGFFKSLLHLTGPVTVQGIAFNENNFMETLEYQVEIGFGQKGIPVEERKALMGELGTEILAKIQAMPRSRWPELLDVVTTALERKQIMVYSRQSGLEQTLDRYAWSGRTPATQGDFVWVVDANLAALKTDGKMRKTVDYQLDARDPSNPTATVTLKYTNNSPGFGAFYTRYRSYTRVYVPEGSTLVSSKGAMAGDLNQTGGKFVPGQVDVMKELGKTVFGAFWSVEPGRTGELTFTYRLPSTVSDQVSTGSYRLDWPKQAGADKTELSMRLKFPRVIKSADPAEPDAKWGDANYDMQADTLEDRVFTVKY